jgi:hypothetical protein
MDSGFGSIEGLGAAGVTLLATRECWLAEVGGFGARPPGVDEIGMPRKNQQRRQSGRKNICQSGLAVFEIEFIELAGRWQAFQPNAQGELWCIDIGHNFSGR